MVKIDFFCETHLDVFVLIFPLGLTSPYVHYVRCSMLGFYIAKPSRRHEMPYAASFCPLYSLKEHGRSSRQQLLTEEQVRKRLSCIVTYSVVVGSLRECLVSPPSSSSLRGNSSVVVSEEIYGTGCCCCCLLAAASIELPQRRDRLVGLS